MPCPVKSTSIVTLDRLWSSTGFDSDVDDCPDRAVDAADTPCPRWVDVGDLRGHRPLGETDTARRETPGADAVWPVPVHVAADDAVLPLDEAGRVGDVVEDLLLGADDADGRGIRSHHWTCATCSA
jgi:hypothetical protein